MNPVRIYLVLAKYDHTWETSVYRDLDTVKEAWEKIRQQLNSVSGLVHFGFDKPDLNENLLSILEAFSGCVLLTESSKWGLPLSFKTSSKPIGTCQFEGKSEPCFLYVGLRGWGYDFDESLIKPTPGYSREPSDWLKEFFSSHSDLSEELQSRNIYTDAEYLQSRSSMPDQIVEVYDKARFDHYRSKITAANPYDVLSIAPLWLLNSPISRINPTVRLQKVCENNNINLVQDFLRYKEEDLLRFKNFGKKSLRDLAAAMIATFEDYYKSHTRRTLFDVLESTLDKLPKNAKQIIYSRLGVNGKPLTLQQLGDCFNITRERIRQIEKKYIVKIVKSETWDDKIIEKITTLLRRRKEPLYLDLLEVEDPWFSGFSHNYGFLGSVLETFSHEKIHIIEFLGREIVSNISQGEITSLVRELRTELSGKTWVGKTKSHIKQFIQAKCLGWGSSEMSSMIFDFLEDELHFANNGKNDNENILVSIGRSVDNLVLVVLEEASCPLHYTEIHKRVEVKAGRSIDIRRIHNILTSNKLPRLYGRGTYGLDKHLTVSSEEIESLLRSSEEIISNGPPSKQWHSAEILQSLEESDFDLPEEVDNYILGVILERSNKLISLGRQVWVSKYRDDLSTNDRIQTTNAFIAILKKSGHPLSTQDLVQRISEHRGVKAGFIQIHENDLMIKVAPNTWGLINRDIPFSPEQVQDRLNILAEHLNTFNKGIHISEIGEIFSTYNYPLENNQDPYVFLSLCRRDKRFKVWQGYLIGLSSWTEPRKHSFASAFKRVFDNMTSAKTTEEIAKEIEGFLERKVDKNKVSNALSSGGAVYSRDLGFWLNPDFSQENTLSATSSTGVQGGKIL